MNTDIDVGFWTDSACSTAYNSNTLPSGQNMNDNICYDLGAFVVFYIYFDHVSQDLEM